MTREDSGSDSVQSSSSSPNLLHSMRDRILQFRRIVKERGIKEGVHSVYNFLRYRMTFAMIGNPSPEALERPEAAVPKGKDLTEWSRTVLTFPQWEDPDVSIVIPVYNKWGYTYNCLKSILDSGSSCSYEIIIADDNSGDETSSLEEYVKNVIHVRNEVNLNFLRNCNNAAKSASGRYILFLNNDTLVRENWLDSLFGLMERNADIGMSGSKFIFCDGSLQEAGGIIWDDATGWNYGRNSNPKFSEFNYVKDVDYISGASIMIRRELWEEIGGFDERFAPAYFEDSDLAFEVRRHGYRVVYQPKSELIHFENGTMGANAQKLCNLNRGKFLEKWGDVLRAEHYPNGKDPFLCRDRTRGTKHILYIDDMVPEYDRNAGAKTSLNFLQILVGLGYKVTFVGETNYNATQPYTDTLQQMGIEVLYGPWYLRFHMKWLKANIGYFDYVFLNRPEIAIKYIEWLKSNSECRIAYYGHDLHFLREMREYELTKDPSLLKASEKSKETEMYIMSNADIVMSVSPEEKTIIDKELGEEKTIVTPIFFYNRKEYTEYRSLKKDGLLFVGGYRHSPNIDAVKWFVNDILPLIRKKIPDIDVTFAGSNPTKEIKSLESDSIHVPGFLSDEELDALYDRSRVCIIPLRFGAGVKGKTVDAMYHGMAIVSTGIGLEGLPGVDDYVHPSDDAESFADEVVRLYSDDSEIERAYSRNPEYVYECFGYESARDLFKNIFGNSEKESKSAEPALDDPSSE